MAIIPAVPGLSVTITSNGRTCTEHPAADDKDGTASPSNAKVELYLEIEPNSLFEVRALIGKTYPHHDHDLGMAVGVGGTLAHTRSLRQNLHFSRSKDATIVCDKSCFQSATGDWISRKFKFHG